MRILVTGGSGFIGRWVVKSLLDSGHAVKVLDNFSNGSPENVDEFLANPHFKLVNDDVRNVQSVESAFRDTDQCIHLAAQINVQESLDYPGRAFTNNAIGTYNVLEACRKNDVKLTIVGTCMVYDLAASKPISEADPIKPLSPYAGSKAAAEAIAISYFHAYNLPVTIVRPFNTYGPFQKSNMEGGVVSIFIKRYLEGADLLVFGDGKQTRDLLYVEDCAELIAKSTFSKAAVGEILNGGTGRDIQIKDLALLICKDARRIKYIPHHHPQAEIQKLVCNYSKAEKLLGWKPHTSLEQGISITMDWLKNSVTE